jgi:pyruvate/2-oxoglutarate dehydrogenase complex dihydrolipoamide acyltransferase (E2) component
MSSQEMQLADPQRKPVGTDQVLLIVEAMKMEKPITSPARGKMEKILVQEGDIVTEGSLLVRLKSSGILFPQALGGKPLGEAGVLRVPDKSRGASSADRRAGRRTFR